MYTKTKRGRVRPLLGLVLAALAGAALLHTGCDESTTAPVDSSAAAVTIGDVRESVQMTDAQAAELEGALADLEQARQARRNARDRGDLDGHAPYLEFLARASQILNREQLLVLVQTLADRKDETLADRARRGREGSSPGEPGPGPGPGMHGPRHGGRDGHMGPGHRGPRRDALPGLLQQLDLSAEQKQAVRDAARVMHETMQTLREQLRTGALTDVEFRAAAAAAHTQFETTVAAILSAEQNARWQELRRERAITTLERAIARIRAHQDRHLELLAQILGLDETQRAAFATIGTDMLADMDALLQGLRDASIDAAGARSERARIHTEAHDAMRALLSAEQATLFDALNTLRHRRHGPMP